MTAVISPDTPETHALIDWEGASEDPNHPLQATVSKGTSAKHEVKIKLAGGGYISREIDVWVIWATGTGIKTIAEHVVRGNIYDQHSPPQAGIGTQISCGWVFEFTIEPSSILTASNRPDFSGSNTVSPPNGLHIMTGSLLSDGANKKWDVSRRMRIKLFSPAVGTAWFDDPGGTIYDDLPSAAILKEDYPANSVVGNDDTLPDDENNIPDANGKVESTDVVGNPTVRDAGGNVGNSFEFRAHFGEFLRLEIEGGWSRISDFVNWRVHGKLKKASEALDGQDYNSDGDLLDELWINDGSVSDNSNTGW